MYEEKVGTENELGGEHEDSAPAGKRGCLFKACTVLVLIAFAALAVPEFSYLFNGSLDFMIQHQNLRADRLVQESQPAVVFIETVDSSRLLQTERRQGTGFNLDPAGLIITNKHVVESSSLIVVNFPDGQRFFTSQYWPVLGEDLAIISLDSNNLPAIGLETDTWAEPGDVVTVIGNPLGFNNIAQRGKVKQLQRSSFSQYPLLEIQLPIQQGSSGSPVLNQSGRVVGIIVAAKNNNPSSQNGSYESTGLAIAGAALEQALAGLD